MLLPIISVRSGGESREETDVKEAYNASSVAGNTVEEDIWFRDSGGRDTRDRQGRLAREGGEGRRGRTRAVSLQFPIEAVRSDSP